MKARLVELPNHASSPPHCCVVTGRTDGKVIDFGDLTPKARGPHDPRVYVRRFTVETAAAELCGMVKQEEVDEIRKQLEESEAERKRLESIVAGAKTIREAEADLRRSLAENPHIEEEV